MGRWVLFLLLAGCLTGLVVRIPEETGSIEAYFCDQTDCKQVFEEKTNSTSSLSCALYHANDAFFEILEAKNARLVVDEEHPLPGAVKEFGAGLMHNKFCIINGEYVWTGSWNPAQEMTIPNNVVFIQSKTLAKAYQAEFDELYSKVFHGGESAPGLVRLNGNLIEAYFCPEDNCKAHVFNVLRNAKSSIHFMTFSFTDDEIGGLLVEKINSGIEVKGVFDPRKDKYSEYEKLKDVSKVVKVHHKVFIVDGSIVITGSYNPTGNGNKENDENVIIIRDADIAKMFEKEFARLFD
ncbi:Cardiolipin synthase [uncultured archaeon]|nr:Cardiolipin synthase [uncultured archaeon]